MVELIETERLYVEELQSIMEGYYCELDNSELSHLIPPSLENKRDVLFGNLPEIYQFHHKTFRGELENCAEKPELVGTCFLKRKEELKVYEKYCQNKPRSEVLWRQCGDSLFFQECQKKLDHKLSLDAYLLKPVQRITKYQLMLKEMIKCNKGEGGAELEEALATVLDIIKSVNDSLHQIAITGFEGNLSELGKLLMQGSFNVWTDHKKGHSKVKDLARFKPMQRHLFLYDKMLLFCKKREETSEGHEKTPSYSFKHSLKAPSMDVKNMWVSEIRKVLQGQLEACREASHQKFSDNIYGGPIRNVKKMALRQSDSSSPESGFRRTNPSPNTRQKRADPSVSQSAANARKRFSLQGLSNRRSLPAEPTVKEAEVPRRFSLTSSLATSTSSTFAARRNKDTLRGAMASVRKRQSIMGDSGAGGPATVPRSTSQPANPGSKGSCWTQRRLPSMDTEDFETIPSSAEESSNSSEEEGNNKNGNSSRYRVQLTYESRDPRDLSLDSGEMVQFLEEAENGQWLVKSLRTEETGLVPSSILQTSSEGDIFSDLCTAALSDSDENEASTWGDISEGH
ncbi:hypothetical protein WMY93_024988 [Mugilogobius chulae]|uniref:Guanine nucleotide exchange factor DBS-like n=1 Tax=Mugilogobius chulae TaxID=88201 RepID=A0AAW0N2U1_9GOBI